ncbi:LysR family transcriptional regulator [Neptunomonas sp. XY-337]|uniref:LysR family transcriptional regulator n=1 Tax=Neptunomonas sp. XY-337 TaxID=2561897 RepID=UPI0010AA5048|nr:LysR family transcriptional regulator [Neptunomonas sp. XY-337]
MNRSRQMSIFTHIVEQGSISAAADHLELSKSVVSQHLKTLESELGTTLLIRTTRRQHLTDVGQLFYQRCREMNEVIDSAWDLVRSYQVEPQGRVTITAPDALMNALVAPAIAAAMSRYPKLRAELISSDEQLSLSADTIDLAIRVGSSAASTLKQRRIGSFRDQLCATPALAAAGISENTLYIANRWQGDNIEHHLQPQELSAAAISFKPRNLCRVNSLNTAVAMISSGGSIGLVPDFLVRQLNTLVPLFPDHQLVENPVYALHPYNSQVPRSVAACLAAIEDTLEDTFSRSDG